MVAKPARRRFLNSGLQFLPVDRLGEVTGETGIDAVAYIVGHLHAAIGGPLDALGMIIGPLEGAAKALTGALRVGSDPWLRAGPLGEKMLQIYSCRRAVFHRMLYVRWTGSASNGC